MENPAELGAGGSNTGTGGSRSYGGTGGSFVTLPADAGRPGEDASCGDRCKVVVPYCGDGVINQTSEACDDGNTQGGDGCTAACDQIEDGWVCPNQGQACLNIVVCGDKKIMGKETCDDGNTHYTNMSSTVSTGFDPIGATGGWIGAGKETLSGCDKQSMQNASFTTEMRFWFEYQGGEQFAFSGDDDAWVFVNRTLVVDLGGLHGREDGSFTLDASDGSAVVKAWNHYYDGTTYTTTQGNDDGVNTSKYNGCGPHCIPAPYCGDGKVQAPDEECDDGVNVSRYGGCAPGCHAGPRCGDGKVQSPWEDCDDGVNSGDYGKCGSGCHYGPRCGDGIVQSDYEQCDGGANCRQDCKWDFIF